VTAVVSAQERAAEVGADGYRGTPFEVAALLDLVARYTG